MQKITIIGLGDVLRGDHGAACYVLESVATKTDSGSVQFAYMGNDPRFADELLYSADLAIVVGTMRLSGVPGGLHIWNGRVFKQHAAWMSEEDPSLRHLLIALARADLAGGFPRKIDFHLDRAPEDGGLYDLETGSQRDPVRNQTHLS